MGRYRIGRADTNDIVLADASVSREHAELAELGGGRFQIKDLGSTYGVSIWQGDEWQKVTEAELRHDSQLRIGDYQTTVADLLRDTDRTVVRPHAPPAPPEATAPPAEAAAPPAETASPSGEATAPPRTATPKMATPKMAPPKPAPPRPAAPRPAPPRPAPPLPAPPPPTAPPSQGGTAPPRPAAPAAPAFQFLRNLPPEKRTLVWLGVGFTAFLMVALITLILALAL